MRTIGELSGLAVLSEAGGERLGRLQDVRFAPMTGQIDSFLVSPGGVFAGARVLPRLMVRALGADALLTETGDVFNEGKDVLPDGVLASRDLHNRPVLSDTGTVLGHVHDVLVDEGSLTINAYLLSLGGIDHLLHGFPVLPLRAVKAVGPDSIIVPAANFDISNAERHR